jgi:hypothetical protein
MYVRSKLNSSSSYLVRSLDTVSRTVVRMVFVDKIPFKLMVWLEGLERRALMDSAAAT